MDYLNDNLSLKDKVIKITIISFVSVISLIALFWIFIYPLYKIKQVQNWVPVKAIVNNVSATQFTKHSTLEIQYSYTYKGINYTSNQYNIGGTVGFEPNNIAAKYPKGKKFTCFVNPDNPSEAIVSKEASDNFFLVSLLFLGGIIVLIRLNKKLKTAK